METAEQATEGSPLKPAGDGSEPAAAPAELQKKSCQGGFSRMSHWRTAAFFLSLFLCLTVVFAFSFIIPCPERPQYKLNWSRDFSDAVTYDFLAVEHANSDKVMDVLIVIRSPESSPNKSCSDEGLTSPCLFLLALDGTKGETLWERPLGGELNWAQCSLQTGTSSSWHCLLSHSDNLTAVNKHSGAVFWQQPRPSVLPVSLPVLSVPDLDGDRVGDVVLVLLNGTQTQMVLLSGQTGDRIGSEVTIGGGAVQSHLLHRTEGGSYYVLLQRASGVFGLPLREVAARAKPGLGPDLKRDKHLEKTASNAMGLVPIYLSEARRLLRIKDWDDSSDLLVVSRREVALVDGLSLKRIWRFNGSSTGGFPSFGHFNRDEVLDLVVEVEDDDVRNSTKVAILDGGTGGLLWEEQLQPGAGPPRLSAVHTTNSVSVFMFWGLIRSGSNSSESSGGSQRSYMLHPLYPNVLLEFSHDVERIVAYRATLMERGRHAAYFLLTGPEAGEAGGAVVLTKRKLKQDVPLCSVRHIRTSQQTHSDAEIREAFNRLRFSSDW
ncbi:protein FAM234A [Gambusia affinis]|uniref:protein FAM234A n=1 Tax=Gambusia affinis TaxID=33528 RepID=UPI001CDC1806|nr:protein FAM234A [Gambusia affinis]XP_043957674.1 protein FAM234A [Gambusia affinis]